MVQSTNYKLNTLKVKKSVNIFGGMLICGAELRKLADQHKNVEQKKEKRNIIEEYSNFASKVYSTPTREGTMKGGLGSTINTATNTVLSSYSGKMLNSFYSYLILCSFGRI